MFERFPVLHLRTITALMITGLLIHICWPAQDSEERRPASSTIPMVLPSHALDQPERAESLVGMGTKIPAWTWQEESIKPGDNLSVLFERKGIPASVLLRVTKAANDSDLKRIAPGQTLEFRFTSTGEFSGLRLKHDALTTTEIVLDEEGQFTASTIQTPFTIRPIVKVGHITKKQSYNYC